LTKRFDRLIKHLEEVEAIVGGQLRDSPRDESYTCPIVNFLPDTDRLGNKYCRLGGYGWSPTGGHVAYYHIERAYTREDGYWWANLSLSTRSRYTNRVSTWIKERSNQ
jgi:hypothetical protein